MLIPFTAKRNANNACIAFCEGNGSIDSWAIIKNEAVLPGIKILATVTKNWLQEAWVLAYLNTNNSGGRRIFESSQAWAWGTGASINLPAAFTKLPGCQLIGRPQNVDKMNFWSLVERWAGGEKPESIMPRLGQNKAYVGQLIMLFSQNFRHGDRELPHDGHKSGVNSI